MGGPMSLLADLRDRCFQLLSAYLGQSVQPNGESADNAAEVVPPLALRRGDVLLTGGNTRMASIVRRITRSPWAHVAIYVGPLEAGPDPRCIVEADVVAGVRTIRLSSLAGQRVRVLRPARVSEFDKSRLSEWIVARVGDPYDVVHAWSLGRCFLRMLFGPGRPSAGLPAGPARDSAGNGAARFICSTLLAQAFLLIGYPIIPTRLGGPNSSEASHLYVIPEDFDRAPLFDVIGR